MNVPVYALVYGLVAWINGTGMIEPTWPEAPLEVRVADHAGMATEIHRCMRLSEARPEGMELPPVEELQQDVAPHIAGVYCNDRITVNGHNVDPSTPEGQTVLVHELVHWLQDHNGTRAEAPCIPQLEPEAYEIQAEWQRQMGLPKTHDDFTVFIRSQCPEDRG